VRITTMDRFNPFRDQFLARNSNAAELAQSVYNTSPIRPFDPVPEPGTPPPNYFSSGRDRPPGSGKTPPIFIPPVQEFPNKGEFRGPPQFAGPAIRGFTGQASFGREPKEFTRPPQFAGPAIRDFTGQASFGRDLREFRGPPQFAGPATRGFNGQAVIDRAGFAQRALNGVRGRRNVFNRLRGFQLGQRSGRGGRIPVFSGDASARFSQLARANESTRPQAPVNQRYSPFINRANPRFQNLVNLL